MCLPRLIESVTIKVTSSISNSGIQVCIMNIHILIINVFCQTSTLYRDNRDIVSFFYGKIKAKKKKSS